MVKNINLNKNLTNNLNLKILLFIISLLDFRIPALAWLALRHYFSYGFFRKVKK